MGSNKSGETITRQWAILQLIPKRTPSRTGITSRGILDNLIAMNYDLHPKSGLRTIQRDLETLSGLFPLEAEQIGKTFYWYTLKSGSLVPNDMGMEDALAVSIMKDYLTKAMPVSMSENVHKKISQSIDKIASSPCSLFNEWYKKFRIIPNSHQLLPPKIRPKVIKTIQEALVKNRKIKVSYDSMSKGRSVLYLCPLYLICRTEVFYLVARFKNVNDQPYNYAVHRIRDAEILDETFTSDGDNIDDFIQRKTMDFGSGEEIKFHAKLRPDIASHLMETKLSEDQEMPLDGSWIKATVKDTWEFKFWLMSRCDMMEILEPIELRDEVMQRVKKASDNYFGSASQ